MSGRRLLIVVNDPGFFLSHRVAIALAARDAGYEVTVATPDGAKVAEIVRSGLAHLVWEVSRAGIHPVRELRSLVGLAKIVRQVRPHVIHLVTIKPVLYGGLVARFLRAPAVVYAVSGMGFLFADSGRRGRRSRRMAEAVYRVALRHGNSRVIVQNEDDHRALEQLGALSSGQARLIRGSGVDLDRFRPRAASVAIPLVVLPARMLRDKGVREFAEAAAALRARGVAVRMALVGGLDPDNPAGMGESELRQWCEGGAVEWWGHREDMAEVFAAAHLVVLPSYREGLPKALIEAAASGRAIVTTDAPGCREVVDDGENGLLVPPRDGPALADAIATLLTDPDRIEAMGRASRRKAEREFGIQRVVDAHLELYSELCCSGSLLA